ncbi:MAG: hypothetical protein ACM3PY_08610, partial [Omnitrophica WOR_2 bacterium]
NAVEAEKLCTAAYEDWSKFGGDTFHALAGWVLLAIAVSQRDLGQAKSIVLTLLDPNPAFRPIEEPLSDLLSQALSACQKGKAEVAYQYLNQALEQARASGEL